MLRVLLQLRHRRFRRDLSAYLDGMLPQRARRRLEAHLDSCQTCRQELADLRVTVEALGSLPMAEVPRSFALAAAPIAEVRPLPTARRLEFGLRLATATAAFALTLVLIGDFAGLPGGGEKEMPAHVAPAAGEMSANLQAVPVQTPTVKEVAPGETPAAMEAAPAATGITDIEPDGSLPRGYGLGGEVSPTETPAAATEAPPVGTPAAVPVETPAVEETPPALVAAPVETPGAEGVTGADETSPAPAAVPIETPAVEEMSPALVATPIETPELEGITEMYGEEAPPSAGVSEEELLDKEATAEAGVEEKVWAYSADAQAAVEEEGGGLSREEAVRWLEIGLGAGVGILVLLWAVARLRTSIGNRP
ncbi:MAG: zf-HC2 domain-containing protein [Dehalococcoidia bacterium]|nr:zf-HC2 domain-containing protein [Dehalococcoidia bacterium]